MANLVGSYPMPFGHYERELWTPDPGAYGGRRARRSFPFEAFVPVEIGERAFAFSAETSAALQDAALATAALNERGSQRSGLEALATQLLRSEALASSRIEGLELSHRRLARAAFEGVDRKATEVMGNVGAMQQAVALGERADPLTAADLDAIHATLLSSVYDEKVAGRIRDRQNWIGTNPSSPSGAEFVPPPPRFVAALVDDLCAFVAREDLPEFALAGIAHAQFETIHPYADGNGRLGRCLIHFVLKRRGLAPRWVPPISLVLARRRSVYVDGLTAYRAGDVDAWVLTFAEAAYDAATAAHRFTERVAAAQQEWLAQAGTPRAGSAARVVIDRLPDHPVVNSATVQHLADCSDVAALRALDRLESAGVLRKVKDFKRNRTWECPALFDLLNEFEDQPLSA